MNGPTASRLSKSDREAVDWLRAALKSGEAQERRRQAGVSMAALTRITAAPERGTLRKWENLTRVPRYRTLSARVARAYQALAAEDGAQ